MTAICVANLSITRGQNRKLTRKAKTENVQR